MTPTLLNTILLQWTGHSNLEAIETKEWMTTGVYESRAKDYTNPFRKMVYDNLEEMNNVIGKLEDNSFIKEQQAELQSLKKSANAVIRKLKL